MNFVTDLRKNVYQGDSTDVLCSQLVALTLIMATDGRENWS